MVARENFPIDRVAFLDRAMKLRRCEAAVLMKIARDLLADEGRAVVLITYDGFQEATGLARYSVSKAIAALCEDELVRDYDAPGNYREYGLTAKAGWTGP